MSRSVEDEWQMFVKKTKLVEKGAGPSQLKTMKRAFMAGQLSFYGWLNEILGEADDVEGPRLITERADEINLFFRSEIGPDRFDAMLSEAMRMVKEKGRKPTEEEIEKSVEEFKRNNPE